MADDFTADEQAVIDREVESLRRNRRPHIVFWSTVGAAGLVLLAPVLAYLALLTRMFIVIAGL